MCSLVAPARKSQGDRVLIIRVEFRARVGTSHTATARWGGKKRPETSGIEVRESDCCGTGPCGEGSAAKCAGT